MKVCTNFKGIREDKINWFGNSTQISKDVSET